MHQATVSRVFGSGGIMPGEVKVVRVEAISRGDKIDDVQAAVTVKAVYVGDKMYEPAQAAKGVVVEGGPDGGGVLPVAVAIKNETGEPAEARGVVFVVEAEKKEEKAEEKEALGARRSALDPEKKEVADAEFEEEPKTAAPAKAVVAHARRPEPLASSIPKPQTPSPKPSSLPSSASGNPTLTPIGGGELEVALTLSEAVTLRDAVRRGFAGEKDFAALHRAGRALEHACDPEGRPEADAVGGKIAVVVRSSRARVHLLRDMMRGRMPHPLETQGVDWDIDQAIQKYKRAGGDDEDMAVP